MSHLLETRGVSFSFGDRVVLENISFALDSGSCTALIGPNGVGKTTLLRMLSGALAPTSGDVLLQGKSIRLIAPKERARRIALVPQQLDMPFDFTVEQVVQQGRTPYLGLLRGLSADDRRVVDGAIDRVNAAPLQHRIFNELSGGERQRVKIALGLAQGADLLLLDEPTQNLDIGRQVELLDLLHSLRDEGITLLASIHDLHLVQGNFSEVLLLSPDRELTCGAPEVVMSAQCLARAFQCEPGRHPLLVGAK